MSDCNCLYNGKTFDCPTHSRWAIEIKMLKKQLDMAKGALEFYGNQENWLPTTFDSTHDGIVCSDFSHARMAQR